MESDCRRRATSFYSSCIDDYMIFLCFIYHRNDKGDSFPLRECFQRLKSSAIRNLKGGWVESCTLDETGMW